MTVPAGETGKPFMKVFLSDDAESLARRCFDELRTIWSEKEVRGAFSAALAHEAAGRPERTRLQPSELWMLSLYELWLETPGGSLGDGRPNILGFAQWFRAKHGGQSDDAVRKQLGRLLKIQGQKPPI